MAIPIRHRVGRVAEHLAPKMVPCHFMTVIVLRAVSVTFAYNIY